MSIMEDGEYAAYSDMLDEREERISMMGTEELCARMRDYGYTDEEIEDMRIDDMRRELFNRGYNQ